MKKKMEDLRKFQQESIQGNFEGVLAACEYGYGGRIRYDPGLQPQMFRVPSGCSGFDEQDQCIRRSLYRNAGKYVG